MSDPLLALLQDAALLSPAAASVPSGSGGRRSVGVSVSEEEEGTPDSGTNSKLYSVARFDRNDSSLCFGLIGFGSTFCCKVGGICATARHAENKITFREGEGDILVIKRSSSSAYASPQLTMGQVPDRVWEDWQDKSMGLKEWTRRFQALDCDGDSISTVADVQAATEFISEADRFKTPSKRKGAPGLKTTPFGDEWEVVPHDCMLPDDPLQFRDVELDSGKDSKALRKAIMGIETSVIGLGTNLTQVAGATLKRFQSNEKDTLLMAGMIQTLKANLGTAPANLDQKFESPSVWTTAAFISDELIDVGLVVWALDAEFKEFKTAFEESMSQANPEEAVHSAMDRYIQILTSLMAKVKEMAPELSEIKSTVEVLVADRAAREEIGRRSESPAKKQRGPHGSKVTRFDEVDEISQLLDASYLLNKASDPLQFETRGDRGGNPSKRWEDEDPAPIPEFVTVEAFTGTISVIDELLKDVDTLKNKGDASATKFADLAFKSHEDCFDWVQVHFTKKRYGLIMDPLIMLDKICGDDLRYSGGTGGGGTWKTMAERLKMNVTTGVEAAAAESLANPRPRLFHTGDPSMIYERNVSRLNRLKKHTDWKSGGGGIREFMIKRMNALNAALTKEITTTFSRNIDTVEAYRVTTLCLSNTVTAVTQLIGAVDAIYEKLHDESKFSTDAAWCLTMQILDRICEELYLPKDLVMQNTTLGNADSMCAHIIYSSIKCHDVVNGYMDLQFENHPSVSTEFIRFLATNSGSEKVDELSSEMEDFRSVVTNSTSVSARAEKKSDTATARVSDLVRELAALTRKVKVLEERRS